MDTKTAWQTLRDYAEGRIHHANAGSCPDSIEGPTARDSDCPLCQALDATQDCLAQIEEPAGAVPAAVAPQGERQWICPTRTVADLVNNLLTMDQALPVYGAQYIEKDGRRCAIAVPPTVSRERVKDGRWIGQGEELNAAVIWTRAEQPAAMAGSAARKVFIVATGETSDGAETYTRHDDAPPPLCDAECLYTAPAAPALEAPAAPAGDEEADFKKWFQGEQGKPYQGMWEFARAAWMARAATAAAPQAPAAPVGEYTLVDEGGPSELAGAQAQYSIERADGTTLAWINGDKASAEELMAALRLPMPISRAEWIAEVRSFLCQGGWDEPVAISTARDLCEAQDWLGQDIEDPRDAAWNAFLEDMRQAPHSDDLAVDRFASEMKSKLAAARAKGRGGWETCPPDVLSRMLREHTDKGDPRDVANFCMFLWCLGHPIGAAPAAPAVDAETSEDAERFRAMANAALTDDEVFGRALDQHPDMGGDATIDDVRAMFDAAIAAQAKEGGEA